MDALPYYKWLWIDYRANRKVQRMSWQAKGLYRELLDEFWSEGSLPNDTSALADICGCPHKEFVKHWPQILPCFEETEHGLVNPKMDEQRTSKDAERAVKARAGAGGGKASNSHTRNKQVLASAKQVLADDKQVLEADKQMQAQPDIARALAEQSRAEATQATPFTPSITDQANACAGMVMFEAPLSGMKVRMALEQAARHEITNGIDPAMVGEVLLSAWREFKTEAPKLEYLWGAEKFFGEGHWKDKTAWPWKSGNAPPAKRKYLEVQ